MAFNFECPYCGSHQVVTDGMTSEQRSNFYLGQNEWGNFGIGSVAVACANIKCQKVTVRVWLAPQTRIGGYSEPGDLDEAFLVTRLLPESLAKPQPDFIPAPIREDYTEACRIRDLSPKASATLSRRCLQGMIRDFCGISKGTLFKEIEELRKLVNDNNAPKGVTEESVDGIDHVRGVGNVGAHMEKDINLIVSVEPDEAQLLIELIETLFDEWYVAREKRRVKFAKLGALAESKKELSAQNEPNLLSPPADEAKGCSD